MRRALDLLRDLALAESEASGYDIAFLIRTISDLMDQLYVVHGSMMALLEATATALSKIETSGDLETLLAELQQIRDNDHPRRKRLYETSANIQLTQTAFLDRDKQKFKMITDCVADYFEKDTLFRYSITEVLVKIDKDLEQLKQNRLTEDLKQTLDFGFHDLGENGRQSILELHNDIAAQTKSYEERYQKLCSAYTSLGARLKPDWSH